MRKESKKKTRISFLAVLTATTVFIWLSVDIFMALTKSSVTPTLEEEIEALDPNLDNETLDSLKERKTIRDQDLEAMPEITEFAIETEIEAEAEMGTPSAASPSAEGE